MEEDHGVAVDVVVVGDCPLDDAARRRSSPPRARRSSTPPSSPAPHPVSVFAEIGGDRIEVFVRDRGPGFDPETVPDDRRGVRESIVGRMRRHGGDASVHTGRGPAPRSS